MYKQKNFKVNFVIKNNTNSSCMLKTSCSETHYNPLDTLKSLNMEFITFTPKEKKVRSILLKGMYANTTCEDVLQEISRLKPEDVDIHKISICQGQPKNGMTFLVQIKANSIMKNLTNIKYLLHQVINLCAPVPRSKWLQHGIQMCQMHRQTCTRPMQIDR
ncbi:hypothetical protein TKK_0003503 [Trichogramma kaykai]